MSRLASMLLGLPYEEQQLALDRARQFGSNTQPTGRGTPLPIDPRFPAGFAGGQGLMPFDGQGLLDNPDGRYWQGASISQAGGTPHFVEKDNFTGWDTSGIDPGRQAMANSNLRRNLQDRISPSDPSWMALQNAQNPGSVPMGGVQGDVPAPPAAMDGGQPDAPWFPADTMGPLFGSDGMTVDARKEQRQQTLDARNDERIRQRMGDARNRSNRLEIRKMGLGPAMMTGAIDYGPAGDGEQNYLAMAFGDPKLAAQMQMNDQRLRAEQQISQDRLNVLNNQSNNTYNASIADVNARKAMAEAALGFEKSKYEGSSADREAERKFKEAQTGKVAAETKLATGPAAQMTLAKGAGLDPIVNRISAAGGWASVPQAEKMELLRSLSIGPDGKTPLTYDALLTKAIPLGIPAADIDAVFQPFPDAPRSRMGLTSDSWVPYGQHSSQRGMGGLWPW
jgi:hypothetical protein